MTGITADFDGLIFDLSVPLSNATAHFPTDPAFRLTVHADFPTGGSLVSRIDTGLHIGTHVDAPLHVLPAGLSITGLPLRLFLGDAIAVDAPKGPGQDIGVSDLRDRDIRPNDIVLFRTGWEERSGSPRFFEGEWPGVSPAAADALIRIGVKAIGFDSPSADSPRAAAGVIPAHKRLLGAGVPIFEALVNLTCVVGRRFFFIGLPLGIKQGEASPVRAVALMGRFERESPG